MSRAIRPSSPCVLDAPAHGLRNTWYYVIDHHPGNKQSKFVFADLGTSRVNTWFGISDLAFSIGDDSIADFVSSIQFLPVVQMVSHQTGFGALRCYRYAVSTNLLCMRAGFCADIVSIM